MPDPSGSLGDALRETTRLMNQARATRRALSKARDHLSGGLVLGTYTLAPGEDVGEVIDLLRLAVEQNQQEVVLTITALRGTDQGDTDA